MKIREKITFYGRVQAVGFRYRSQQFAKESGLAGTVKNCSDGSVEMEIEGNEREINEFLDKLCHSPYIKVVSLKTEPMELKQENEFRIIN